VHVTFFDSPAAPSKREAELTLDGLRDLITATAAPTKAALPWLKLARFGDQRSAKGSLRNNANVAAISGVEADYDAEALQPAEAAIRLDMAGVTALVYTSPSHRPDRPRWRVLCPLSAPQPPNTRAALVARLNAVLGGGLARESFTLSQAYYFGAVAGNPAPSTWIVDGAPLDTVALTAEAYPAAAVALPLPVLPPGLPPDQHCAAALTRAAALFAEPGSVGQRHQTLLAAALLLAPMVKSGHLDAAGCVGVLSDAMESGGRCPNDGEVDSALAGAVRFATPYEPPTRGEEFGAVAVNSGNSEPASTRELTEDAAALAFAVRYGDRFRFDTSAGGEAGAAGGAWMVYQDGMGWARDTVGTIHNTARDFVRLERETRGFSPDTKGAATVGFAGGVVRFARYDPRLVSTAPQWDADPWRLGVPGGSVDLRSGVFSRAEPSMLIRRRASVAPADTADCPTWFGFLDAATAGDRDLQSWLQRLAGYMLTGDTSEEVFAFVYGPGGNGKGTFLAALETILGDYAYKAPTELFKAEGRIPKEYQLAKLEGCRAVFASETERGAFMAEGFVKEVTGNEGALNARHPYGSPFTFKPTFKLVIVGNHAPRLAGRTDAMERRMRVVPFNVKPPQPDPTLKARLAGEYAGILRWALEGCAAWQRHRLGMCGAVATASDAYFAEQDSVSQWVADCCAIDPNARFPASAALQSFNAWLRERGERNTDAKTFKAMVSRLSSVTYGHTKHGTTLFGVGPIEQKGVTDAIG